MDGQLEIILEPLLNEIQSQELKSEKLNDLR